jgi:hypothetical protein
MPNTPAKLPEDLVRPPHRYVRDMAVGETGWIEWSDMVVDLERHCYLYAEGKLKPEETGFNIRVTRTASGFGVVIPARPVMPIWTLKDFQPNEDHLPVVKLERRGATR